MARRRMACPTKHDGAEVESILIDQSGLGQALRPDWSANLNLARGERVDSYAARCGRSQEIFTIGMSGTSFSG